MHCKRPRSSRGDSRVPGFVRCCWRAKRWRMRLAFRLSAAELLAWGADVRVQFLLPELFATPYHTVFIIFRFVLSVTLRLRILLPKHERLSCILALGHSRLCQSNTGCFLLVSQKVCCQPGQSLFDPERRRACGRVLVPALRHELGERLQRPCAL